jgi:hypothetical protein
MKLKVCLRESLATDALLAHSFQPIGHLANVVRRAAESRIRGGLGFEHHADLCQVHKKVRLKPDFGVPLQDLGIEEVPRRSRPHPRTDAGTGLHHALGGEGLERFAKHRTRHAEAFEQIDVTRQETSLRLLAGDDRESQIVDNAGGMRTGRPHCRSVPGF